MAVAMPAIRGRGLQVCSLGLNSFMVRRRRYVLYPDGGYVRYLFLEHFEEAAFVQGFSVQF